MNTPSLFCSFVVFALCCLTPAGFADTPVDGTIAYQGNLSQSGSPASGSFDLQFRLFDASTDGTQIGGPVAQSAVAVVNGAFEVMLNFGEAAFRGGKKWLQIEVRQAGGTAYVTLNPRQPVASVPLALTAKSVGHWEATGTALQYAGTMREGSIGLFPADDYLLNANTASGLLLTAPNASGQDNQFAIYASGAPGQNLYLQDSLAFYQYPPNDLPAAAVAHARFWIDGTTVREDFSGVVHAPSAVLGSDEILGNDPVLTVGTTSPSRPIQFDAGEVHSAAGFSIADRAVTEFTEAPTVGERWVLYANTGLFRLWSGRDLLTVNASGVASVTALQITGGADLAEPFSSAQEASEMTPGLVVCADEAHEGKVKLAVEPYDPKVVGIISGANGVKPGLLLRQENTHADGDLPVAMSGRVYCWCDASLGPIKVGDLLTTSQTPGHAMAVRDKQRALGAVIGKALTSLKEGKGQILVLVMQQ